MLIKPHRHTKDTGQHKDLPIRRGRAHKIKCMCTKSFTWKDLKTNFHSGRGCENDIIISFRGVFPLLFSLSHQGFLFAKIRSDPSHNFVFVLSQLRKVQFVYSSFCGCFFSFLSLFLLELQHGTDSTRTTKGARGEGSREKSPLILCRRKMGVGEEEERAVSTVPSVGQLGSSQTKY